MKTITQNLLCTLVLCCAIANAQTVVNTYGNLTVNGNHVTSETGEEISLAGMSLFWSIAGDVTNFYNAQTVNHLADDWKISVIRAAMGVNESWDGGNGYADGATGRQYNLDRVEPVIQAAIDKGIYVIVDWHSHDAENYLTEAKEFFGYISDKYGDNDHILYEIYNEPINQSWADIKTYAEEVIAVIRANDPDNLIIVGTPFYSQRVDQASQNPITAYSNIAYTLHFYAASHTGDGPGSLRDNARKAMSTTDGYNGIALFVTEWGTVEASGNGGFNESESNTWINFMKDNGISHANWTVGDKNESSCVVNNGMGVTGLVNGQLTPSGVYVRGKILEQAATLSVEDLTLAGKKVKVYPVPFKDTIKISGTINIDSVVLTDMSGKEVFTKETNEMNPSIAIPDLATGNYILSIISNGEMANTVITKTK